MSRDPHIANIFSAEHEPCLSLEEMNAFLAQKLEVAEKHRVERHLLNCELCAIAIEGVEESGPASIGQGAEAVTEMAWDKAAAQNKKKRRGAIFWISAAASVAILLTVGAILNQGPTDKEYREAFAEAIEGTTPPLAEGKIQNAEESTDKILDSLVDLDGFAEAKPNQGTPRPVENGTTGTLPATTLAQAKESISEERQAPGRFRPEATEQNIVSYSRTQKDQVAVSDAEFATEEMSADDDFGSREFELKSIAGKPATNTSMANAAPALGGVSLDSSSAVTLSGATNQQTTTSAAYAWQGNNVKAMDNAPILADNKKLERQKFKSQASGKVAAPAKEDANFSRNGTFDEVVEMEDAVSSAPKTSPNADLEQKVNEMDEGMLSYKEGRYADAAEHLRKATQATPGNLQAHVLAADAYLRINQPQAAIYHAERVLSQPGNSYFQDAQWYKALALISLKEGKKAKELLLTIKEGKGKYAAKAAKALETLD